MTSVHTKMYIQIVYIHKITYIQGDLLMRDKTFTMRTDPVFRDNLDWLSKELGLPKTQCIELAVNLFPELVKLYTKLEQQVKDIKDNL